MTQHKVIKWTARSIVFLFALIGFFFVAVFFAVKWNLTSVKGMADSQSLYFLSKAHEPLAKHASASVATAVPKGSLLALPSDLMCRLSVLKDRYPENATPILHSFEQTKSESVVARMLDAVGLYTDSDSVYENLVRECMKTAYKIENEKPLPTVFAWTTSEEWAVLEQAIVKDKDAIDRASKVTGIEPRMIVSQLIAEQMRLFTSEREVYKRYFQPLAVLGNETKFSLGVTGVKEETAIQIENNLKDPASAFYPGSGYENLLDFTTEDPAQERFDRITDKKDHYYAYLYTALFIKEIQSQWKNAGYDISKRPEIITTLFNIGFAKSKPNATPETGGSSITIGGETYTFGRLGYEFYYSGELQNEFPFVE